MRSWIVVLVFAIAACSKDQPSGPAVVPGAPAGDVLEVTGAVTAKRGGEMRGLAVGDEVSGDDVIGTGAEASVVIQLRHNGVKWSLKGGRDRKLADSAAWKAPARGHDHDGVGDPSTAAGRHAEREAADTTVSNTAPVPVPETHAADPAAAIAPAAPSPGPPAMMDGEEPAPFEWTFEEFEGPLDRGEIERTVIQAPMSPCVTSGTIVATIEIGADGAVKTTHFESRPGAVYDLVCAQRALGELRFPAADAPTKLTVELER